MIDYPYEWQLRDKLRLAKTLFYIDGNNDYNFREFLEEELLRLDRANRKELNPQAMNQRQGACQVIDSLLGMMKGADAMYDALKKTEQEPE